MVDGVVEYSSSEDSDLKFVGSTWLDFFDEYITAGIIDRMVFDTQSVRIDHGGDEVVLTDAAGVVQLGSRITLVTREGRHLVRRSRTEASYISANDPRVLFGLGTTSGVDRVEVTWPDGTTEQWVKLSTGQYHSLIQGTGEPVPENQ